jgi:toxin ParE1/3/4
MKRVFITDAARQDQLDVWLHIAADNFPAANELLDEIDGKIEMLAESPELGRIRPEIAPGLRYFPVGNYLIFYTLDPGGITVLRILHGARQLEGLL